MGEAGRKDGSGGDSLVGETGAEDLTRVPLRRPKADLGGSRKDDIQKKL